MQNCFADSHSSAFLVIRIWRVWKRSRDCIPRRIRITCATIVASCSRLGISWCHTNLEKKAVVGLLVKVLMLVGKLVELSLDNGYAVPLKKVCGIASDLPYIGFEDFVSSYGPGGFARSFGRVATKHSVQRAL